MLNTGRGGDKVAKKISWRRWGPTKIGILMKVYQSGGRWRGSERLLWAFGHATAYSPYFYHHLYDLQAMGLIKIRKAKKGRGKPNVIYLTKEGRKIVKEILKELGKKR